MSLTTDLEALWGESKTAKLTAWDDADQTTKNITRLALAIRLAKGEIYQRSGLGEPADSSGLEYDTYLGLLDMAAEFVLLRIKSRDANDTREAERRLTDALKGVRRHNAPMITTNSPFDVSNEEPRQRIPDFGRQKFRDRRLRNSGSYDNGDY